MLDFAEDQALMQDALVKNNITAGTLEKHRHILWSEAGSALHELGWFGIEYHHPTGNRG